MVWSRFPSEKLLGIVLGAMSCFFGCFRIKASNPNLTTPKEEIGVTRSENRLSSLFLVDGDFSQNGQQSQKQLHDHGEVDVKELKNEAKFLITHGIIPKTPLEIQEVSEKLEGTSPRHGEGKSMKCEAGSFGTITLDKQYEKPTRVSEEPVTESGSTVVDSSSSCMTDGDSIRRADTRENTNPVDMHDREKHSESRSFSSGISAPSIQCQSSHFDFESHGSALAGSGSVTNPSLNPNPSGEMQSSIKRNNVEGTLPSSQKSDKEIEDLEQTEDEASLTAWFKPISSKLEETKEIFHIENVRHRKIPSDRPILGMVAAHWNEEEEEEEISNVSPKWWDGNGIPNSTNKYKEDQKVSWHATPFEERLEKALSEESFISQRKPIRGTPLAEFDEAAEESDTALSRLESSAAANLKSVVSF